MSVYLVYERYINQYEIIRNTAIFRVRVVSLVHDSSIDRPDGTDRPDQTGTRRRRDEETNRRDVTRGAASTNERSGTRSSVVFGFDESGRLGR